MKLQNAIDVERFLKMLLAREFMTQPAESTSVNSRTDLPPSRDAAEKVARGQAHPVDVVRKNESNSQ